MKDHPTDRSRHIDHLMAVLSGEAKATSEDLPVLRRLSALHRAPDFDSTQGYERLVTLLEKRAHRRRLRRLTLGAAAAVAAVLLLVLLPREQPTTLSPGDDRILVRELGERYLVPDSLRSDYDLRLECEDGSALHLRLGDHDTLMMSDIAPLVSGTVALVVPRTRQGRVLLADGTLVTLNSASRLRIRHAPGPERSVALEEGEALMQVAHDEDHPFVVAVGEMKVQVLGTTFDLSLYPEQPPTATLLDGSLRVSLPGDESLLLHPGEEAVTKEGVLTKQTADLRARTAWVEGKFIFHHLPLSAIMDYLGRWYGFETIYADESLKATTFTGALRRDHREDFVFEVLEKTTRLKISYHPESRQVIISRR